MSARIKALQTYLKNAGFDPGAIDGVDGAKTTKALIDCQVARGGAARRINKIVVHCTATRAGQAVTVDTIRSWHRGQGWNDIGYHRVILLDGTRKPARPEAIKGSHVQNHNHDSIGVTYVGGLALNGVTPQDTRTPEQKAGLEAELKDLAFRYPGAIILGHRDLSPDKDGDGVVEPHEYLKACPSFDAPAEYRRLQAISA
jgi:N-acetylmuramoyl-L-alanine amidase